MSLPWLAGDEKLLIWSSSAIKLLQQEAPPSERFALINTSYDLTLIDRFDDFGFPVGNQAITDRMKLAELMAIINEAEEKPAFVFFDILLEAPTDYDSMLQNQLASFPNHMLSYHLSEQNEPILPIIDGVNIGLSDYVVGNIFEGVYKYQLIYEDSLKLSPLKIYEKLHQTSANKLGPLVRLEEFITLNNFIINYRVLQKDIENPEAGFNPISLGELLFLPPEEISRFLAGKIVIVGDFLENDMHETMFEITSGPLILMNVLLSLESRDTYINGLFWIILTIGFLYISYMSLTSKDVIEEAIKRQFKNARLLKYMAGFASYLFILTGLSLVTFFIFNIHLNVFFLACYCYGVDKTNQWFRNLSARK